MEEKKEKYCNDCIIEQVVNILDKIVDHCCKCKEMEK